MQVRSEVAGTLGRRENTAHALVRGELTSPERARFVRHLEARVRPVGGPARVRLAEARGDARKREVRAAISASGVPYAQATWSAVEGLRERSAGQ